MSLLRPPPHRTRTLIAFRPRRRGLAMLWAASVVLLAACGGGGDSSAPLCLVTSMNLSPITPTIAAGATVQLNATLASSFCSAPPSPSWTSSASSVASVSSSGLVTGVSAGTASITANAGTATAAAVVTVTSAGIATIVVNTSTASINVGSTVQATADVRDAAGVALTRSITWLSSNSAVATVNANGLITGVTGGTATITASGEGKSGSKLITVIAPAMTIVSMTPTAASTNVSVEAPLQVTFTDNVDPATVTAQTVTLTKGGAAVTATRTVNGKVVTLAPVGLLQEFSSAYQLGATTGVKSTSGTAVSAAATTSFATVFWDSLYYYRLTNDFRPGESLDTPATTSECSMSPTSQSTGQFWFFVPYANAPGYYHMHNQFGGGSRAIEGADSPGRCFLSTGTFNPLTVPTGMFWKTSPFPNSSTSFFLQTWSHGTAKSLDTPLFGGVPTPSMQATGTFSGQSWTFTRLARR